MLLLLDRGFLSYKLLQNITLHSCQVLARVKSRLILRPIELLPDDSYLAKLYPNATDG